MTTFSPTPAPATLHDTLSVVDSVLSPLDRRLPPHVSREDLASAGKVALVEAMLDFTGPAAEARAYCYVRVRGAVLDELRRLDPLSRQARARVKQVRAATLVLERELGRAPNEAELSTATGFASAQLRQLEALSAAASIAPLDGLDEDDPTMKLADPAARCPARTAESGDARTSVQAALARLPANHAHVLRRYHLDDATLEEIAAELDVSKERVRQIREAAEKKLRADFVVLALWQALLNQT